jgi:putative DNA primase/helicase
MDQSKPKTFKCPACGNDCTKLFVWGKDGRKVCYSCEQKDVKETEAKRRAFKEEGELAIATERDAKKAEALRQKPGRVELGHWVENIEGIQFMTRITTLNAATVKPEPQRWLWRDRIPAGAITWGVGKPGNAKSLWATDLGARVSSGADFPDGAKNENGPRKVLMYCGEDDIKRTVIPRLMAANANLANIELLDNQSFEIYDKEFNRVDRREINLAQDCPIISHLIGKYPDIALLIIDPTTGVWGGANTNHDKDMRPIMNDLRDLCEAKGLTLVGISHTSKRGDASAIDQMQGASSIAGAARAAWLFTRDPESDDEHAHAMTCIKSNLTDKHDGLKLLTVGIEVNKEVGTHPAIVWGDGTKMQADETNQALKEKRETKGGRKDALKIAILALLADGAKLSMDVYSTLEKQGHSGEYAKKVARDLTNEKEIYRRQKGDRWYMVLPEHLYEFDNAVAEPEVLMAVAAGDEL